MKLDKLDLTFIILILLLILGIIFLNKYSYFVIFLLPTILVFVVLDSHKKLFNRILLCILFYISIFILWLFLFLRLDGIIYNIKDNIEYNNITAFLSNLYEYLDLLLSIIALVVIYIIFKIQNLILRKYIIAFFLFIFIINYIRILLWLIYIFGENTMGEDFILTKGTGFFVSHTYIISLSIISFILFIKKILLIKND